MQHTGPGAQPPHQQIRLRRPGEARNQGDFCLGIQRGQRRQFRACVGQHRRADAVRGQRCFPPPKCPFQIAGDLHRDALIGQFQQGAPGQFQPASGAALQNKGRKIRTRHAPGSLIGQRQSGIKKGNAPDRRKRGFLIWGLKPGGDDLGQGIKRSVRRFGGIGLGGGGQPE